MLIVVITLLKKGNFMHFKESTPWKKMDLMYININMDGCSNSSGVRESWELYPCKVMKQLDGALWIYINMDGCSIIWEICNSGVRVGGIWELDNLAREIHLYEVTRHIYGALHV
jgi:hypothetical protein